MNEWRYHRTRGPAGPRETSRDMSANRVPGAEAIRWLQESHDGHESEGFDGGEWGDDSWLLHAMYETDGLAADTSHDDVAVLELARESREGGLPEDIVEFLSQARAVSAFGRLDWSPDLEWTRLRWDSLAERLGIQLFADGALPTLNVFPYASWPINIDPPDEGSLDDEQHARIVEHLGGPAAECFAFFSALSTFDYEDLNVYKCALGELEHLREQLVGPTNVWPPTREWLLYTHFDLCGTRVHGSRELLKAIRADPMLETADLRA